MKFPLYPIILLFALGFNISAFSQTADAGPDQEICMNHTFLAGSSTPPGYTGTWTVISGYGVFANLHSNSTEVTSLLKGTNELRWSITDGSNTYMDNVIIQNNTTTQAYTGDDVAICMNYHTLSANTLDVGETGLWTVEAGTGSFSTPLTNVTDVTGISQGLNTYRWTISKGICSSFDDISVTNNQVEANAGFDETTCNDYTVLNAVIPSVGTGSWSIISSSGSPLINDIYSPSTTVTSLGINTNNFQWTVVNENCSDYDNVIITSRKPTTANAGSDKIICSSTTTLAANNPLYGTGAWSVVSGTANFSNLNAYNATASNLSPGTNTLKWTITYYTCSSEDNVDIYNDYFTADAGVDDITCYNNYTLNANDPSPGTGEWRVTGGSGTFADKYLPNTSVSNLIVGENTYEWKITRGSCIQTDYVIITRNSPSTANAGPNKETCNGVTNMAALNPTVGSGSWSVISGTGTFANSNLNTTSVSNVGLNANIYRWTVTYATCSNYDDATVTNNYVTAYAGSDQELCANYTSLNASVPASNETGTWQILAGSSTIANVNLYNTDVTNLSFGLNKYRWTITKGTCNAYDEVQVYNNQYLASASVSGPSDICVDFASILGNIPPSGSSAYWTVVSGNGSFDNSLDESTVVRNLAVGENVIRWTINRNGCLSHDNITINRFSVYSNAGIDQNICTQSTTLNGNSLQPGETGLWSKVSGTGTFVSPESNATDVTGILPGISIYKWTVTNSICTAGDDVMVTNNTFFVSAGTDQQVCGSSTVLTSTNPSPGTGLWQVVSGTATIANPTNYTTSVSDLPSLSSTTFRWTVNKNGCSAQDEMTVFTNSVTANAGSDFTVCNNFATLNGNNPTPGTGTWTIQQGGGTLVTPSNPNSQITGLSSGANTIRWTIYNLTCVTYDEVVITNYALTTNAGSDKEVCENQTNLSASAPPVGGTGLWQIVSGNGTFQNPSQFNTLVTNLQSGLNTFKWTVFNNGCSSPSDEVTINNKTFSANAGDDQILDQFVTETYMQASLPIGGSGQWTLLSGGASISDISDPGTFVSGLNNGINTFRWFVNYNGCTAYDYVNLTALNFEAYAGMDKTICSDSIKLNARDDGGIPQIWSVVSGQGTFDDPGQHDTWVRNVGLGLNVFRWSVTINGATDTDDITIISVTADAGVDQITCENHATLNANIPQFNSAGQWEIVAGAGTFSNPTLYNTQVSGLTGQTNTFSWTISTGSCFVNDYVSVIYNYAYAYAGNDQILCKDSTYLSADQPQYGSTGHWSVVSGYGNILNPSLYNSEISDLNLGENTLRWIVTSGACSDEDEVILLNDEVIAYAGPDQYTIHNFSQLNAVLPVNATGIWTKEFGSGIVNDPYDPQTTVSNLSVGQNIFKWTLNSEYCTDFDAVALFFSPNDVNDLNSDLVIYPNPFSDLLYIELDEMQEFNYQIIDISGHICIDSKIDLTYENSINTSNLKPGVYFIRLYNNTLTHYTKLIKEMP